MFSIAAVVPAAPLLVPQLCGADGDAHEETLGELRAAVLDAAKAVAAVADRWLIVGSDGAVIGADHGTGVHEFGAGTLGTFRGFGVDLRAGLSAEAMADPRDPDPWLPLSILIGGWLRERVAPSTPADALVLAPDTEPARCAALGARYGGRMAAEREKWGVLVVADGAATLSTAAPGYLDDRAAAVQAGLDSALRSADRAALAALDPQLCADLLVSGRAAWQLLAGMFAAAPVPQTQYQAAPFGVGYHVGLWLPAETVQGGGS